MKGRKKQPDDWHVMNGTKRKDRENPHVPEVEESTTGTPLEFDSVARGEWERIKPILEKYRMITALDESILEQYCLLYAVQKQLQKDLMALKGAYIEDGKTVKELVEYRQVVGQMQPLISKLGLAPLERTRLRVEKPKDKPQGFAALK